MSRPALLEREGTQLAATERIPEGPASLGNTKEDFAKFEEPAGPDETDFAAPEEATAPEETAAPEESAAILDLTTETEFETESAAGLMEPLGEKEEVMLLVMLPVAVMELLMEVEGEIETWEQ